MPLPRTAPGIVLAVVLLGAPPFHARASGTNEDRQAGLALYRAGRFAEAIPHFDKVLASHRRDIEVLITRGACFLRVEQPEKALADFEHVNQYSRWASRVFGAAGIEDPGSTWRGFTPPSYEYAENWGNRGIALLMLGRDEQALASFMTSVGLWSSTSGPRRVSGLARALQGAGQAYHRLGQNDESLRAYTQSIGLDPTDPNGFVGRGDTLASLGRADQAIVDYSEAIRLDPSHSRAHGGRGSVLANLGRDDQAIADLDRAITLDLGNARAYRERATLHAQHARNEAALADFDTIVRLIPQSAGALKDRGGMLVRLGRFDRAIDDLNEAIRLDPKRATAYQNRGAAYNGLGQYERAIDDLSKAIELDPDSAGAYTNRGLALYAVGRYDQAVVDLSQAIELAPRLAIPRFNRALVLDRLGWQDRALDDFQQAIRIDPRFAAAYAASGRLRDEKGQRDQAIRDYDMALQLDPKEGSLYQDRGNARRQNRDWLGALADYDRAILLDPRRAASYVARGWSRLSAGVDGADYDARAYLSLKGWNDGLAPFMAVLAVLAARESGRPVDAARTLEEALANLSPRAWPVPVLRYFEGGITESALLEAAVSTRQQAEAHAFLGLDRLRAGDHTGALRHLRWARDHGQRGSIAVDVATTRLARLEPAGSG
jgi:tetratricopeptide (TPR) repeat protein